MERVRNAIEPKELLPLLIINKKKVTIRVFKVLRKNYILNPIV
jgi:hypothetical protein